MKVKRTNEGNNYDALKYYYGKYLSEIRGLSSSSVKHYYDALNNISRKLRSKGLIQENIYEIMDLNTLKSFRQILFKDLEFIEQDQRGRRMYSAGLNNYIRFASGEDFRNITQDITKLDVPLAPKKTIVIEQNIWNRSSILRRQALALAGFSCEINKAHESFIAEKTGEPYMEGHHAIPMQFQSLFPHSLDIYANIVCLCPICHRKIHYGLKNDRKEMICKIYEDRAERLDNSGIKINRQEFIEIIMNETVD